MKDITPESDFSNIEPPLLSDFEMVLAGMERQRLGGAAVGEIHPRLLGDFFEPAVQCGHQ